MRKPYSRIVRAAGPRRIKFRELRHGYASQLVINGVSMKAVRLLLGHSDTRQTMRHADLSSNMNSAPVATLHGNASKQVVPKVVPLPSGQEKSAATF